MSNNEIPTPLAIHGSTIYWREFDKQFDNWYSPVTHQVAIMSSRVGDRKAITNLFLASPDLLDVCVRSLTLLELLDGTNTISNTTLAAAASLTKEALIAAITKAKGE